MNVYAPKHVFTEVENDASEINLVSEQQGEELVIKKEEGT